MTNVTGVRSEEHPNESERFVFPETQRRTGIPALVVLIMGGVVSYLRTAFPDLRWPARADEDLGPPSDDDMVVGPARFQIVSTPSDAGMEADAETVENKFSQRIGDSGDIVGRYADNVVRFPSNRHVLIDSPPFRFAPLAGGTSVDMPPTPPVSNGASPPHSDSNGGSTPKQSDPQPTRRNRSPDPGSPNRLNEAVTGGVLLIGLDELLKGTQDADGDELQIRDIRVSEGSIARTEGGFVYSSNAASLPKTVTVVFEVTDGTNVVIKTALIPLVRGPIMGTAGAEILVGSLYADQIDAGAGNDIVDALEGNDVIMGGDGDDQIVAGGGNDTVFGGRGNDVVFGGDGDDLLVGGEGDDRLSGDAGNDVLLGDVGNDQLRGGEGADLLAGGDGDDHLAGDGGDDVIRGEYGDDIMRDGDGADRVMGGDGNDTLIAAFDAAEDFYDGGDGSDILNFTEVTVDLYIDLVSGTAGSTQTGYDTITGFEQINGGSGNDVFTIGGQQMRLSGGDGEDTFLFELPESINQPTLIHDILDFVAGDRIKVADFEFSMDERDEEEDQFERYYRRDEDDPDTLELRIRHRHDEDEGDLTIFEFDGNGDFAFEMTVAVHGYYQPFVYEHVTA